MTLPLLIGIGLAGGAGAIARFVLDGVISERSDTGFPLGTFAVNLTGAFALGVVVGAALGSDPYRLVGTGFIGAYTTFSTWALESHRLGEDGQLRRGGINFAASLLLGLLAAWAGRHVGGAL